MGLHKFKLQLVSAVLAALALPVILAGCGPGGPSDGEVLISLTDEVVVPAYQDVAATANELKHSVDSLCNGPSATALEAARQSWRDARASWMRSESMWFGPVMDRRSSRLLDWSPTDTAGMDEALSAGTAPTVDEAREVLGSDRRGFGAMEHLLFSSDDLSDPSRGATACAYLSALAAITKDETAAISAEWSNGSEGRPAYKDYFSDRAEISILPSAAVADVVRTQFFLIRDIVDVRLAAAMGLRENPADLTVIPGNAADNGLVDIRNELLGMWAIYEGSGEEGLGIGDLVSQLSEDTDARLREQFNAAIGAIDGVGGPLRDAIGQRTAQVQTLYDRLADVQLTIGTEVVSLLGVSIGFTDTDGDSMR